MPFLPCLKIWCQQLVSCAWWKMLIFKDRSFVQSLISMFEVQRFNETHQSIPDTSSAVGRPTGAWHLAVRQLSGATSHAATSRQALQPELQVFLVEVSFSLRYWLKKFKKHGLPWLKKWNVTWGIATPGWKKSSPSHLKWTAVTAAKPRISEVGFFPNA